MTFDAANNRWKGTGDFNLIMNGSMHPDTADTALVFTAPKDGQITCTYHLSVSSPDGDGVIFYMMKNDESVAIGDARNGGILVTYDALGEGAVTLTVKAGDKIAFIINKNQSMSYDSTAVSLTVECS